MAGCYVVKIIDVINVFNVFYSGDVFYVFNVFLFFPRFLFKKALSNAKYKCKNPTKNILRR